MLMLKGARIVMAKKRILIVGMIMAVLLIGLSLLVGFARGAEPVDPEQTAWLESTLIMHRGLHDDNQIVPENSIPAFAAAGNIARTRSTPDTF